MKLETWGGGLLFVRWIVLLRLSYLIIFILKNDRSLVNAFLLLPSVLNIKVWCVLFLRTMSSNVLFLSAAVGTLLGAFYSVMLFIIQSLVLGFSFFCFNVSEFGMQFYVFCF